LAYRARTQLGETVDGGSNVGKLERGLAFVFVLTLAACGGSGSGADEPEGEETSGGDTAYEGPITSTDIEGGKELFSTHCDDCHPGGEEDVGPSLIADPHTPARLRQQIREGSGKMRPFSENRLSDEDLESLLAYLQTINAVK
jgi:mono/diheme cytochrome c family protein